MKPGQPHRVVQNIQVQTCVKCVKDLISAADAQPYTCKGYCHVLKSHYAYLSGSKVTGSERNNWKMDPSALVKVCAPDANETACKQTLIS